MNQTETGKAFEFAIVQAISELVPNAIINQNKPFETSRTCFGKLDVQSIEQYRNHARAASYRLLELEPILREYPEDISLIIQPDSAGASGDVRDIVIRASRMDWEIGISAKHRHFAVKHSRLSQTIDFGDKWLHRPCSERYFEEIQPIFDKLLEYRVRELEWKSIPSKDEIYRKITSAFRDEFLRIADLDDEVPEKILRYLIGRHDFYKIVKVNGYTTFQAFHFNGTLNRKYQNTKPTIKLNKLKAPTRIIELDHKLNSVSTLHLTMDEGWQISFRIHNASTNVEPSLKFDISLIGQPPDLYSDSLTID